ncbi:ABC transporter ATP-binding protein [Kineosporia sp. J2-2]|uniref:ABC transporter ATP-binding protein n=1 Tax=Kineosporia corallincola TaxID=2835133 RepID=A0ABS5TTB5_9ACTN|nr:ABC transporter ATP-binding protein [Kineosporia corallincola]MBT0774005.1 ABC transporter ATP-binding protein [Kineosporia corallincola]
MLRDFYRILPGPERRQFALLTGWLGAAAVLHGVALGLTGLVIARCLDPSRDAGPAMTALGVAVVAFLIVQWVAQAVAFRVGSTSARALHVALGEHLSVLPLGWFTPARQAEAIATATGGVTTLMSYPALLLRPAMTAVITPVAAALTLVVLDWRYTLTALGASVIAWYVSRFSGRLAASVDDRRHAAGVEGTSRLLEYAQRQHLIRTDGADGDSGDLRTALGQVRREALRSTGTVIPGLLLFGVTLNALFAVMVTAGAVWIDSGTLDVPVVVGALVVLARLSAVASAGAELAASLRLHQGLLTRLAGMMNAEGLTVLPPAGIALSGHLVEAEAVSFRYGSETALDTVSLTLPRQGLTALVGASGAGKTTLIRLLARFWDPDAGTVVMDGMDLRTLHPEDLYGRLATVLQDDYLLDASVGENIRAGRPGATDAEVARAVAAAGLEQTVAQWPAGLETPAGPGGSRLSGGQRQRVCVARALLKAAPLTLMDEATSALDPANRRLVLEAAHRLARAGSVVLVAHDLATVVDADQILVMDAGRVVQRGTHAELAGQEGVYRRLLASAGSPVMN